MLSTDERCDNLGTKMLQPYPNVQRKGVGNIDTRLLELSAIVADSNLQRHSLPPADTRAESLPFCGFLLPGHEVFVLFGTAEETLKFGLTPERADVHMAECLRIAGWGVCGTQQTQQCCLQWLCAKLGSRLPQNTSVTFSSSARGDVIEKMYQVHCNQKGGAGHTRIHR